MINKYFVLSPIVAFQLFTPSAPIRSLFHQRINYEKTNHIIVGFWHGSSGYRRGFDKSMLG
jgi:hypothetical protein